MSGKINYNSGWIHPDDATKLIAENKELLEATLAYQELCTCYRLGRRPSEKLFAKLKKADKLLEDM